MPVSRPWQKGDIISWKSPNRHLLKQYYSDIVVAVDAEGTPYIKNHDGTIVPISIECKPKHIGVRKTFYLFGLIPIKRNCYF